jgi:uncharacterized protein (DUF1697 family)
VTTWIALFRGINVGGHRLLPMKDLVALLERDGFEGVRSYIQSGNVVLRSSKGSATALARRIADLVRRSHGFAPQVFLLSAPELERAVAANPFPDAAADPKALHLFFLSEAPRAPDVESLHRLKTGKEVFALAARVFYLHTPDGFGVSKLAARAERLLGVDATARNWRTVQTLLAMVRDSE